jgi:hypothetical protein
VELTGSSRVLLLLYLVVSDFDVKGVPVPSAETGFFPGDDLLGVFAPNDALTRSLSGS